MKVLDSGHLVASLIKDYLHQNNLINDNISPKYRFCVSDYTTVFEKISEMFFEDEVHLETIDLWK